MAALTPFSNNQGRLKFKQKHLQIEGGGKMIRFIKSDKSGPPPEKGPNSQGACLSLKKRGRNYRSIKWQK